MVLTGAALSSMAAEPMLDPNDIMTTTELVADYFIANNPDVGAKSYVGGKERNSKIWTRGVFYEGLLNAYRENPRPDWLKYCVDWGEFHSWESSTDAEAKKHNADYQCCGQAYLQLYMMEPDKTERKAHIRMRIDDMISQNRLDYWSWVDAIQMSAPVMALLGETENDTRYTEHMYRMYRYTRDEQGGKSKGGGSPLFNTSTGLWYRDYQFDPPYRDLVEPDKDCYWSRGNGWVYMALARILQFTPSSEEHRALYESDFSLMSEALAKCQRADGSWNVSLAAPSNFGQQGSEGPEMTGTSLFVGGLAWGVNTGLLDAETYLPVVIKGWEAMLRAVHPESGKVGYLQGTGSAPEHGGVITYDSTPDFEDFGVGCWLWGAGEVHALARTLEPESGVGNVSVEKPAAVSTDGAYYDMMGRRVEHPASGTLYIYRGRKIIF